LDLRKFVFVCKKKEKTKKRKNEYPAQAEFSGKQL